MKKTLKTLMTLGLASVMLFTTAITSFAAAVPENVVTIFGQTPVQRSTHEHATTGEIFVRNYEAIIYGRTTLNADDIKIIADGWTGGISEETGTIELFDYTAGEGDSLYFTSEKYEDETGYLTWDLEAWLIISYIPEGTPIESLGEDAKYVIYTDGAATSDTSDTSNTSTSTQDTGDWASNETGWWIQFKDGSYLTNSWWQSPYSGLWYYMGADGYMVTNTTIDGYTINADGVWVQ